MVDPAALAVAVFGLAALWLLWRWPRTRHVRLSVKWGSVYVFQDRADPNLFKVGVTARLSKTRKREVARSMADGSPLRQILAIDMPHARSVETIAHRRLRPLRPPGPRARRPAMPDPTPRRAGRNWHPSGRR